MSYSEQSITEVVVVVPANDEELLIAGCLDALCLSVYRARSELSVECRVVVVLDSCSDTTASIAARYPFVEMVEATRRNVGAARAHGIACAIEASTVPHRRLWIANTDADSRVPQNWLVHQLGLASSGVDMLIGSVYPVGEDLGVEQVDRWQRAEMADPSALRVHGANLGVRAETYLSVGGFDPHPEHEDVMLVERVIASGARVISTDECPVATSARLHGRTPGGFAAHLRENY